MLSDKAAVGLQIFATCCCSLAFAMLVGSVVTLKKTREASFVWLTYLGQSGGCLLVLYALTQLIVLCTMSGIRNRCEQMQLLPGGRGVFFCPPVRCWHPGRNHHTCRGEWPCRQRTTRTGSTGGTRSFRLLKILPRTVYLSCFFFCCP